MEWKIFDYSDLICNAFLSKGKFNQRNITMENF